MAISTLETSVIRSSHPPLGQGRNPNSAPEAMFENFKNEKNLISPRKDGWYLAVPLAQYVPEDGKSFHALLAKRDPHNFLNIRQMSSEDLLFVAQASLVSVKIQKPGMHNVVPWNVGYDITRKTSQSWDNNHFHMVGIAEESLQDKQPGIPREIRELASSEISYISKFWMDQNLPQSLVGSDNPQRKAFVGFPDAVGGTAFQLPADIKPEDLAVVIKELDTQHSILHRGIFELLVTNYDQAISTKGTIPYNCRPLSEIFANIDSWTVGQDDPRMKQFKSSMKTLARFFHRTPNQISELDPLKRVITPPAYSATLFRDGEEDLYLAYGPHFLTYRGGMEILGLKIDRTPHVSADMRGRRHRANQHSQEVSRGVRQLQKAA